MSLMNRLQRLTGEIDRGGDKNPVQPGKARTRSKEIRALRERIDAVLGRRRRDKRGDTCRRRGRGVPLEELVSGEEQDTEGGVSSAPAVSPGGSSRHGRFCIRDLCLST